MVKNKLRKSQKKRFASCITLHDSVALSTQPVHALPRGFLRTALALLGVCACFAMLFGFMTVPIQRVTFYFTLVISTLFFAEMLLTKHRAVVFFNTAAIILLIVFLIRNRTQMIFAVQEMLRSLSAGLQENTYVPPVLSHNDPYTIEQYLTIGFCLFGFLVSFVFTLLTVYRPNAFVVLVLSYAFLGVGVYNGLHTNSMAVFCWLAYLVGMIVITDSYDHFERRKTGGYAFSCSDHKLIAKPDRHLICTESTAWLLAIAVMLLGACCCVVTTNDALMDSAHGLRLQVREKWNHMTDAIAHSSIVDRFSAQSSPDHKRDAPLALANRENPSFNGETVFSVTINSMEPPDVLYLKTSTFSVYSGTQWQPLPDTDYDGWENLFTTMQSNRCVPQAPLSESKAKDPIAKIWFTQINPYPTTYRMLYNDSMFQYEYDTAMQENYEHGYPKCQVELAFLSDSDALFSKVSYPTAEAQDCYNTADCSLATRDAWKQYDSFARMHYLQVPFSTDMDAIREDASELFSRSYCNTAEALYAIRGYIHSKAVYTIAPEPIDETRDFSSAFLLETGEGYCVHYATAGVLLCRMMGIPARLATGYVLFGSDIESNWVQYFDDEKVIDREAQVWDTDVDMPPVDPESMPSLYMIDMPDSSSHAWTEVYLPGYGWMPFEFTEGYASSDSQYAQNEQSTVATTQTSPTTTTQSSTTAGTSSTASSHSSATTSATGTSSDAFSTHETSPLGTVIRVLLMLLFCAVGVFAVYLGVHHVVYARRERKLSHRTPNLAAGAAFALLLQVLAFAGITRQFQQSDEEFARMAQAECPYLPDGAMQRAVEIQLAVIFSRNGVTQDEAAEQVAFAHELIHTMYARMPFHKRFVMRWIRHWVQ